MPSWEGHTTMITALIQAAALLTVGQVSSPPLEAAKTQSILFTSTRNGNTDLYLMTADGGSERRLTTNPAVDDQGRCSPDGRFVVFRRGGQAGDLFRLDLVTGEERRLTQGEGRKTSAAWSPDGAMIYFARRQGSFDKIARMRSDGSNPALVTRGDWHDVVPSTSPDGRSLVFHTYRYGKGSDLEVLDLASGVSRRVTALADGSFDYEPFFATDDTILFSSNRGGGHYRLHVLSLTSGKTRQLADTGSDSWGARYSARTRNVVFYTGSSTAWRMMRIPLTGGAALPVTAEGESNAFPDWCPAPR